MTIMASKFLSTPSARRATPSCSSRAAGASYFYPRPPRGGRLGFSTISTMSSYFYPRPPRGGRRGHHPERGDRSRISIHALREEGDGPGRQLRVILGNFYPRPPRGGRPPTATAYTSPPRFLSTPSARRATCKFFRPRRRLSYFYPRPPRGGRLADHSAYLAGAIFLSTPSARRATFNTQQQGDPTDISIHALREEGDLLRAKDTIADQIFLSTPSARRATTGCRPVMSRLRFLSTPSARRATTYVNGVLTDVKISIHALREEGDTTPTTSTTARPNFYPRPPRGGRRLMYHKRARTRKFLSTPSARRAT